MTRENTTVKNAERMFEVMDEIIRAVLKDSVDNIVGTTYGINGESLKILALGMDAYDACKNTTIGMAYDLEKLRDKYVELSNENRELRNQMREIDRKLDRLLKKGE